MTAVSEQSKLDVTRMRVVVLNASFELKAVVEVPRAVGYLFTGKAESLVDRDAAPLRSAGGLTMPIPCVVRLIRYVRLPMSARVPAWTRSGLMRRDGHTCAYCGGRGQTVDHLVPVSRGGRSSWLNTVAACGRCNGRKADRTPEEAGMPLRYRPNEPTMRAAVLFTLSAVERDALAGLGLSVAA